MSASTAFLFLTYSLCIVWYVQWSLVLLWQDSYKASYEQFFSEGLLYRWTQGIPSIKITLLPTPSRMEP